MHFQDFMTSSLLEVLNQNKIYCGGEGEEEGEATFASSDYFPNEKEALLTGQVVAKAFSNFSDRCLTLLDGRAGEVVRRLVSGIVLQPWAPLPLLWVSVALKNISVSRCLGESGVRGLRGLVDGQMASMEPLIRGAAQTNILMAITQLVDPKLCPYQPLANLVFCFWTKGVLVSGTPLWASTGTFLREIFFQQDLDRMYANALGDLNTLKRARNARIEMVESSVAKAVLVICLFLGAGSGEQEILMLREFINGPEEEGRAYSGDRFQQNPEENSRIENLALLSFIQVLSHPSRRAGKSFLHFSSSLVAPNNPLASLGFTEAEMGIICERLLASLRVCTEGEGVEEAKRGKRYLDLLTRLTSADADNGGRQGEEVLRSLLQLGLSSYSSQHVAGRLLGIAMLHKVCKGESGVQTRLGAVGEVRRGVWGEGVMVKRLLSEERREEGIQNREEQKEWGKLDCEYRREQLLLLTILAQQGLVEDDLQGLIEESLEVGGETCIVAALQLALASNTNSSSFLATALRFAMEMRKNEVFWPTMEAFLDVTLRRLEVPVDGEEGSEEEVLNILLNIISEADQVPGLFALVMTKVEEVLAASCRQDLMLLMLPLLAKALTHGPALRKDQRQVKEAMGMISRQGSEVAANYTDGSDHLLDYRVRVSAISLLLSFSNSQDAEAISAMIRALFQHLQSVNKEVTGKRSRHFEGSQIHRVRQRLYQAYVLFCPLLTKTDGRDVAKEVVDTLLQHQEQTSCRYYLEWCAVLLLTTQPSLQGEMWAWLERASTEKVGSVSSFLVIITHALLWGVKDVEGEDRLGRALEAVAPWCMAQQYGTRVVAQVFFLLFFSERHSLQLCDASLSRCAFVDSGRSVNSKRRMIQWQGSTFSKTAS